MATKAGMRREAAKVGLLAGVLPGILTLILSTWVEASTMPGGVCVVWLLYALAFGTAGYVVTAKAARIQMGALGGLVASLPTALINTAANLAYSATIPAAYARAYDLPVSGTGPLVEDAIFRSLFDTFLWLAFGAVLGLLGGALTLRRTAARM